MKYKILKVYLNYYENLTKLGEKEDIWIKAGKEMNQQRSKSTNQGIHEKSESFDDSKEKNDKDKYNNLPKNIQNLKNFSKFLKNFKFFDIHMHPKKLTKGK